MKCPPGCECGKHYRRSPAKGLSRRKCEPGCTCKRHAYTWREEWKPVARKCPEGCACAKHTRSGTWSKLSEEEREAQRKATGERRWARRRLELIERRFGLDAGGITRLFNEQGGLCYACSKPISLTEARAFAVDHDHDCCSGAKACGKCVLGLACPNCNRGFGHFGDDPVLMVQAASRRMERMRATNLRRW